MYVSVAILAILDTIFGAIASKIKGRFDFKVFISGFFGNALLTMMLVYLGIKLNLDIHIAAVVVFVSRMFNNLSIIRRYYIDKLYIHIRSVYLLNSSMLNVGLISDMSS